jgi:hypothetical protein
MADTQRRTPTPSAVCFMQLMDSSLDRCSFARAIDCVLSEIPVTHHRKLLVRGYEAEPAVQFKLSRLSREELQKNIADWEAMKVELETAWTNDAAEIIPQVNVIYRFSREFVKSWLEMAQTKRAFKLGGGKIIFTHRDKEVICTIQKAAGDQLIAAAAALPQNPVAKYIFKKMPQHETLTLPLYNQVEAAHLLKVLLAADVNQGYKDQLRNKSRGLPAAGMPEVAGYGAYLGLMTEFGNLIGILKPLRLSRRQVGPARISFVIAPLADRNAEPMCQGNFYDAWAFLDELNR